MENKQIGALMGFIIGLLGLILGVFSVFEASILLLLFLVLRVLVDIEGKLK